MDIRLRDVLPGYYFNHKALRKDLDRLTSIRHADSLSPEKLAGLRSYFAFHTERLHGHHSLEDKYNFPKVRSDFPEIAKEIEMLEEEHEQLEPLIREAKRTLEEDLPAFPAAMQDMASHLRSHLDKEEALVGRMTFEKPDGIAYAKSIERDMMTRLSPSEKKHMQAGLAWIADTMTPEERTVFFSQHLPFFVTWIYRLFLKKQFEKQIAVFKG